VYPTRRIARIIFEFFVRREKSHLRFSFCISHAVHAIFHGVIVIIIFYCSTPLTPHPVPPPKHPAGPKSSWNLIPDQRRAHNRQRVSSSSRRRFIARPVTVTRTNFFEIISRTTSSPRFPPNPNFFVRLRFERVHPGDTYRPRGLTD